MQGQLRILPCACKQCLGLMPEVSETFGGNTMFTGSDFNRIAGNKTDRDKGHEH